MTDKPTLKRCRPLARKFIADYIKPERQWSEATLDTYMPSGYRLDYGVTFHDPVTVETVSRFLWSNAVVDDCAPHWRGP